MQPQHLKICNEIFFNFVIFLNHQHFQEYLIHPLFLRGHTTDQWKGKVSCTSPTASNFWPYFLLKFIKETQPSYELFTSPLTHTPTLAYQIPSSALASHLPLPAPTPPPASILQSPKPGNYWGSRRKQVLPKVVIGKGNSARKKITTPNNGSSQYR